MVEGEDDRPVHETVRLQEVDDEAGEEIPGRGECRGALFVLQLEEESGFTRTGRTGGVEEVEHLRQRRDPRSRDGTLGGKARIADRSAVEAAKRLEGEPADRDARRDASAVEGAAPDGGESRVV